MNMVMILHLFLWKILLGICFAHGTSTEIQVYDTQKITNSATFHVVVGEKNGLTFNPNQLNANIGDTVIFHFHAVNHTLSKSSLEKPCVSSGGQFDSGFNQYNPAEGNELILAITVDSLEPQWFFCRQKQPFSHCHAGMVFAINPGERMDAFIHNAVAQSSTVPSIVTAFVTETIVKLPSKTPTVASSSAAVAVSVRPIASVLARSTGYFMASGTTATRFTSAGPSVSPHRLFTYISRCLMSLGI